MKKILLLLVTVLMTSLASMADVTINSTNFPDANFRSYLMSQYPSGYITTAQLNARDTLYLYNKGISNMKGVEYFTQLTYLFCYGNNLSSIDVSSNTKLKYLNLGYNKLTYFYIEDAKNSALEEVYLQNNQLTTVRIASHSKLRTLWVQGNTSLTGLYCWRDALTNVNVTNCTALEQLKIYNNYNLATITGLANCTALTWLDVEYTLISDLSAVKSMTSLETLLAGNTKITALETSHSGTLTNLQVAGDTQLTQLLCRSENLTTLKVTGCTALYNLRCYYNYNLESITGLASCTALAYLDCEDCAITELPGVNDMTNLQTLWARNNQLEGALIVNNKPELQYLRVSGNTGLNDLRCDYNNLISLDVAGCTGLTFLDCEVNPRLSSIEGLTDCTALIHFGCDYCAFTSLDMTFCPSLENLYCYNNQLTSLNVSGLTSLVNLNCKGNPDLGDISGLSGCTSIHYLECSNCGLTNLSVTNMSYLEELWCRDNQFTQLIVCNKPHLTRLVASDNSLLEELYCYYDALQQLEVSNCPVLYYIDCDDNQLTALDVSTCPMLQFITCNDNLLTGLNISNNPELTFLWCNSNKLTSLDLSHCSDNFRSLDCRYNEISGTIDVSRFTSLFQLACSYNEISQLILGSVHNELQDIWCYNNKISSLNINAFPALKTLYCHINQLSDLDVSGCSSLHKLYCGTNQISSLRADNCPSLHDVNMVYNTVKASQMGQFIDDLPTWPVDSMGELYVICNDYEEYTEGNVITVAQVNEAHAKGWNVYHENADGTDWEPYSGSEFLRGDVNDDGFVNISDVTALIDYLLSSDATGVNVGAADCNVDGNVNISDVTALIDYLLSGSWPAGAKIASIGSVKTSPGHFLMPTRETIMEMQRPVFTNK